jgi:hypothetical protein
VVALCVGLVLLQGCRRQSTPVTDLRLSHVVSPQPPRVGPTVIGLALSDASGQPVSGARIELEANMSHAGMTPVFAKATEAAPGHYGATIQLSMAGDWIVVAHVSLADGRESDYQFEINGVESQ